MRVRRLLFWIAALCLASLLGSVSQAGTVFSSEGYGWWWDDGNPAARGRGGATIAASGFGAAGSVNPAAIARTETTFGVISYGGEFTNVRGEAGSFRQRSDIFPQMGGVVVLPRGLRLGGLYRAHTDATYDRLVEVEDVAPARLRIRGRGGWNRIQLAAAGSAWDRRIAWGCGLARTLGNVEEDWQFDFTDPSNRDARQVTSARLKGATSGSIGALVDPIRSLTVGGVFTLGGTSRLIREVEVLQSGSYRSVTNARQELPSQWGIGLEARPDPRVRVSFDFARTLWGEAGLRPAANQGWIRPYADSDRIGAGIELHRDTEKAVSSVVRLGFRDETSYVRSADGAKIRERAGTLGFREPIGQGRSALDLAVEFGKRGDKADHGVDETFFRLLIGLAFASPTREY